MNSVLMLLPMPNRVIINNKLSSFNMLNCLRTLGVNQFIIYLSWILFLFFLSIEFANGKPCSTITFLRDPTTETRITTGSNSLHTNTVLLLVFCKLGAV